ncbi:MAG: response regulator, partial [Thiovulaceae bacterium]|nr:response regulator [Sulfurimonadaceae bacterium]
KLLPQQEIINKNNSIEKNKKINKMTHQEIQPIVKKDKIVKKETTPVVVKKIEPKKEQKVKQTVVPMAQPQIIQENFVQTYMMEIIAFIAILILLVIYMFIIKNKHKKEHFSNDSYEDSKTEETVIDTFDDFEEDIVKNEVIEEEAIYELPESSQEIDMNETQLIMDEFDLDTTQDEIEEKQNPTSTVKKREVPKHEKISKDSFKEFKGVRIMIAEDNLINQKVIKGLLSESGIEMKIADDGQEVLNHLEEDDSYSIILMDVHMPHMDGFEATKLIRSNPKYSHITVIALSGDIAADDVEQMRACGMQENLEKPLKMDALYDILYAYSYKNKQQIENQELNIEIGLEVCGGDEEFYKEILNDFLKNYENSTQEIQEYINSNDLDSVHKLLIDITGVTANIGAKNVQELLKELNKAIQHAEDEEYLKIFKNYTEHNSILIDEIKEYIS